MARFVQQDDRFNVARLFGLANHLSGFVLVVIKRTKGNESFIDQLSLIINTADGEAHALKQLEKIGIGEVEDGRSEQQETEARGFWQQIAAWISRVLNLLLGTDEKTREPSTGYALGVYPMRGLSPSLWFDDTIIFKSGSDSAEVKLSHLTRIIGDLKDFFDSKIAFDSVKLGEIDLQYSIVIWSPLLEGLRLPPVVEEIKSLIERIRAAVEGDGAANELKAIEGGVADIFDPYPPPINHIVENGKRWVNWGHTISNTPNRIYSDDAHIGETPSPKTIEDIRGILENARAEALRPVRCFGASHSWAPLSTTQGILIDGRKIGWKPDTPAGIDVFDQKEFEKWIDESNIYITESDPRAGGAPTVTFPPGLATGTLERWLYDTPWDQDQNRLTGKQYCMPTTTFEDVFTLGGIITTASHGTGKFNPTVSDWVVAIEFIDWNGQLNRIGRDGKWEQFDDAQNEWIERKIQGVDSSDIYRAAICNFGTFGIIWNITMKVKPGYEVYYIAEFWEWESLFGDSDEARNRLYALQRDSDSLEFFYYPFREDGLEYKLNPDIYLLRHVTLDNKELLLNEGYEIEAIGEYDWRFTLRDVKQHLGAPFISDILHAALTHSFLYPLVPHILAVIGTFLGVTSEGQGPDNLNKKGAWKIPQWRANHPVNAIGAVEYMTALDIEWAMPLDFSDPSGFANPSYAFRYLIESIHEAFNTHSKDDSQAYPVTITAEMRFFHGSGALLAPEYSPTFVEGEYERDGKFPGWAAPEIVTSAATPAWPAFYEMTNQHLTQERPELQPVRLHQAKQFSRLKNMLKYQREQFIKAGTLAKFNVIRQAIDPHNYFLNPYLQQLLETDNSEYMPPTAQYVIDPDGTLDYKAARE